MSPRLSTTSFAVLGLLALRPLTPYEIAQQMQRSLDYCWPTPERSLYDQPARLVAAGLAEVVDRPSGPGDPRRYTITPAGRDALREWLASDTAPPRFQNEPLLRVLLADQGGLTDLHAVLDAVHEHVAARRRSGLDQVAPYLEGDGLFQDRVHIVALVADLVDRLLDALDDWAADTRALSADWSTTTDVGMTPAVRALLGRIVAAQRARLDLESSAP